MASVAHIIYDISPLLEELSEINRACAPEREKRNKAALYIQRFCRGYWCRRALRKLHDAATIIQKYYRRYYVITHIGDILNDFIHMRNVLYYNTMATKIKAYWKGYYQREYVFNFTEFYRKKKQMDERNRLLLIKIKHLNAMEATEYELRKEREAKKKVMEIISRMHHFLRTDKEGIYSLHGKSEPSWIEELMKNAKFTKYMKTLRKEYNKKCNMPKQELHLTGVWKNCEEAYYLRDKSHDTRNIKETKPPMCLEKPFCLDTRYDYTDTVLLTKSEYKRAITDIMRTTDKTKNISTTDFDLGGKYEKFTPTVPEYFVDFWERVCEIHNIEE